MFICLYIHWHICFHMSIWICIIFTYTYNIHMQYCSYIIRSIFFMECARKWMCRHPHRSSRDLHVHLLCILILKCTWHTHTHIYLCAHALTGIYGYTCMSIRVSHFCLRAAGLSYQGVSATIGFERTLLREKIAWSM